MYGLANLAAFGTSIHSSRGTFKILSRQITNSMDAAPLKLVISKSLITNIIL